VLIYGRGDDDPTVIVALNFDERSQVVRVPAPGPAGTWHEFLFNLRFESEEGEMRFHDADGARWDRVLIPGSYAHIYCRERVWTDDEWTKLLARDRT
jgi:hypothetical protein